MEEKENKLTNKVINSNNEVIIESKTSPKGSSAAGCPSNYGDPDGENCYICDYGG